MSSMLAGFIVLSPCGLVWTAGVDALLGLPAGGFAPSLDLFLSFVDPDDRAALDLLRTGLCLAPASSAALCVRVIARDGATRRLRLTACDGLPAEPGAVVLGVEDLEPALGRDAALAKARTFETALLERMFDNLLVFDRSCRVIHASESVRRGLPRDPLGRVFWELYPAAVGGRFWTHVAEAIERRASIEDEHLCPALGGWIGYRLTPFEEGVLCVWRSLDYVYHVRAMLRDACERVDLAAAGGRVALWHLDPTSDLIWLSDHARDLLGSGHLPRRIFLEGVHADDRGAVAKAIEAAMAPGGHVDVAFRYRTDGASERNLHLRGGFVPPAFDRPRRLAGIVLDMDGGPGLRSNDGRPCDDGAQSGRDLTGAQIRAARGMLRWSVRELSERANVSVATINRIESGDGVPSARGSNLIALHLAMTAAGARFLRTGAEDAAVALADRPDPRVDAPRIDERQAA